MVTKRIKTHRLNFSPLQKPPEAAWTTWKEFIFRNFITGNIEVDPSPVISRAVEQENCRHSDLPITNCMSEAISNLPHGEKQILGDLLQQGTIPPYTSIILKRYFNLWK